MSSVPALRGDYAAFLVFLKGQIRRAQSHAALAVNQELVLLYWQIRRAILDRQEQQGWGARVIDQLSRDFRREFPELKGLSPRNLQCMQQLASTLPDKDIV